MASKSHKRQDPIVVLPKQVQANIARTMTALRTPSKVAA